VLELTFDEAAKIVSYRWNAAERGFAMPIRVGDPAKWLTIQPSAEWKSLPWTAGRDAFKVATDLYYVNVAFLDAAGRPPSPDEDMDRDRVNPHFVGSRAR
jgi:hypothetical protein